jgi:tetratricopeptide (TPR) repeat protein
LERAVNDYSSLIQDDSDNYLAYFYRGEAHRALKNDEAAAKDYKMVLRLDPDSNIQARATNILEVLANRGVR